MDLSFSNMGKQTVSEEAEQVKNDQPPEAHRLRMCDHCGGTTIITRTMLSIYTGKTVRMFECSCGQRTWSEE
jgi:hypothetical protein